MTDPQTIRDEARDAKNLMEDRIFLKAVEGLKKSWFDQLMNSGSRELQTELIFKLQALGEIPRQLNSYINSGKMLEKR